MKLSIIIIVIMVISSCRLDNVVEERLTVTSENLPPELEGLKLHRVQYKSSEGYNSSVLVAISNEGTTANYVVGKGKVNTILIKQNNTEPRVIEVSSILMENDSMIIFKK